MDTSDKRYRNYSFYLCSISLFQMLFEKEDYGFYVLIVIASMFLMASLYFEILIRKYEKS